MSIRTPFSAIVALCLLPVMSMANSKPVRPDLASSSLTTVGRSQDSTVIPIKEVGLQFELPKGWKSEVDENKNVVVSVEDGAVSLTFVIDEDFRTVAKGMKAGLKEKLTEMKSDGEPKQDTHNGMEHISEAGTGAMKETPILWSIDVLKGTKYVTILTFGIQKVMEAHGDEYLKLISSIKKI